MTFLREIFFPEGTQPSYKLWKFQGLGGYDKHPLEWKFQGGGRSKIKVPSVGGMDIFWNYTTKGKANILLQNFGIRYLSIRQ